MPDKPAKRRWTRTEKWLLGTPLLVLVCLFGMTTGKEIFRRKTGLPARVIPVAGKDYLRLFCLSPDGEFSVAQGYRDIALKFYDAYKGTPTKTLQFSRPGILDSLDYIAAKNLLALGFLSGSVEIWDMKMSRLITRLPTSGMRVRFSPDGRYLATSKGELWDVPSKKSRFTFNSSYDELPAFSPDGTHLAMPSPAVYRPREKRLYGGEIQIWDVSAGRLKTKFPVSLPERNATVVGFTPDGKRVACLLETIPQGKFGALIEKELKLFDVFNGREVWRQQGKWTDFTFSPNGRLVALSTWNDCVQLCEAQSGKVITTLHSNWRDANWNASLNAPAVRFTGDGKLLVLRGQHEIYIWNMDEVNAQFAP